MRVVNRLGVEPVGQHGLHFGQGIEPLEEGRGRFAVGEALIQIVADLFRQTPDFAVMGVHRSCKKALGVGCWAGALPVAPGKSGISKAAFFSVGIFSVQLVWHGCIIRKSLIA
jgi:hypothetical protein